MAKNKGHFGGIQPTEWRKYTDPGRMVIQVARNYFPERNFGVRENEGVTKIAGEIKKIFSAESCPRDSIVIMVRDGMKGEESVTPIYEFAPHLLPTNVFAALSKYAEEKGVFDPRFYMNEHALSAMMIEQLKPETISQLSAETYDEVYPRLCRLGLESIIPKTIQVPYSTWWEKTKIVMTVALVLLQELKEVKKEDAKEVVGTTFGILKKAINQPVATMGPSMFAYVYGLCVIFLYKLSAPYVETPSIFLARFNRCHFGKSLTLPIELSIERLKLRDRKIVDLGIQMSKLRSEQAKKANVGLMLWHKNMKTIYDMRQEEFNLRFEEFEAIFAAELETERKKSECQQLLKNVHSIPENKKQQFLEKFDSLTETQQNNALTRFSFFAKNDPYIKMEFTTYRSWSTDINDCYPKVLPNGKMSEGNSQRLKELFEEWQQHAPIIQDATKIGCLKLIEPLLATPGHLEEVKKVLEEEREKHQIKTLLPKLITRFEQLRATKQRDHASWLQSARRIQNGKAERPYREFRKLEHDLAELEALA